MNDALWGSLAQQRAAELRTQVRQGRMRRSRPPEPDPAVLVRCLVRTYATIPAPRSARQR